MAQCRPAKAGRASPSRTQFGTGPGGTLKKFKGYILRSQKNGRYYVGQTDDVDRRIQEHNNGEEKSTAPWAPWSLVFKKIFDTRSEAVRWERGVKARKSRAFIEKLIQLYNSERGAAR